MLKCKAACFRSVRLGDDAAPSSILWACLWTESAGAQIQSSTGTPKKKRECERGKKERKKTNVGGGMRTRQFQKEKGKKKRGRTKVSGCERRWGRGSVGTADVRYRTSRYNRWQADGGSEVCAGPPHRAASQVRGVVGVGGSLRAGYLEPLARW